VAVGSHGESDGEGWGQSRSDGSGAGSEVGGAEEWTDRLGSLGRKECRGDSTAMGDGARPGRRMGVCAARDVTRQPAAVQDPEGRDRVRLHLDAATPLQFWFCTPHPTVLEIPATGHGGAEPPTLLTKSRIRGRKAFYKVNMSMEKEGILRIVLEH